MRQRGPGPGLAGVALVGLATCEKANSKTTNAAIPLSAARRAEVRGVPHGWRWLASVKGATHTMRLDGSAP